MPAQLNGKQERRRCDRSGQSALPPQRYGGRRGLRPSSALAHTPLEARAFGKVAERRSASPDTGQQGGRASCSAHVACDRGEAVACLLREPFAHELPSRGCRALAAHAVGASRRLRLALARFICARSSMPSPPTARWRRSSSPATREPEAIGRSTADIVVIDADAIRSIERRLGRGPDAARRRHAGRRATAARARARASSSAAPARTARSFSSMACASARRRSARPSSRRSAWRRSSASRCCADRRRACTAPMRSAASSRSSRAAAKARRAGARRAEIGGYHSARGDVGASGAVGAWDYALSLGREESGGVSAIAPGDQFGHFNPDRDGFKRDSRSAAARLHAGAGPPHRRATSLETRLNAQYDATSPPPRSRPIRRPTFAIDLSTRVASLDYRGKLTQRLDDDAAGVERGRRPDERRQRSRAASRPARAGDVAERAGARAGQQLVLAYEHVEERAGADVFAVRAARRNDAGVLGYSGAFGALRCRPTSAATTTPSTASNTTGALGYAFDARRAASSCARLPARRFARRRSTISSFPASACRRSGPSAAAASKSARSWQGERCDLRGDGLSQPRARPDRVRARSRVLSARSGLRLRLCRNVSGRGCKARRWRPTARWQQLDLRANVDFLDATRRGHRRAPAAPRRAPGKRWRRLRRRCWRFGAAVLFVGSRPDSGSRPRRLRPSSTCASPGSRAPTGSVEAQAAQRLDRTIEPVRDYRGSAARPGSAFATRDRALSEQAPVRRPAEARIRDVRASDLRLDAAACHRRRRRRRRSRAASAFLPARRASASRRAEHRAGRSACRASSPASAPARRSRCRAR